MALFFQVFRDYSLVAAANRDEHYDRPTAAPELLETSPQIIAGKDLRAGGTWMGVNESGLFVGILNRRSSGEPIAPNNVRSRGLLSWDLLQSRSALDAGAFIKSHDQAYQPFIVVVADRECGWAAYNSAAAIYLNDLNPGLHVFSSHAEVDWRSEKADRASQRFASLLGTPDQPERQPKDFVGALQPLLSDHTVPTNGDGAREAVCVHGDTSGTVSSSIALLSGAGHCFQLFYCPGPPCQNNFTEPLTLPIR